MLGRIHAKIATVAPDQVKEDDGEGEYDSDDDIARMLGGGGYNSYESKPKIRIRREGIYEIHEAVVDYYSWFSWKYIKSCFNLSRKLSSLQALLPLTKSIFQEVSEESRGFILIVTWAIKYSSLFYPLIICTYLQPYWLSLKK